MKVKLKVYTILAFLCISFLFAGNYNSVLANPVTMNQEEAKEHDCHDIDDLNRGNIKEFRDNYIPKEYHPLPEFMVFVDLSVLILILLIGLYLVLAKKSRKAIFTLAILTFAYLGFIRGGCVCPIGAISNTTMGIISPDQVGLASFIIFFVPLLIALIAGRVFCSAGCPLGAVQQIVQKNKKTLKLPKVLNRILTIAPIVLLILTIYFSIQNLRFFACETEPYKAIFFTGQIWFEQGLAFLMGRPMESKLLIAFGIWTWVYVIGVLALGYWVPRPFCRFMCPYGVLLGVMSFFSFKPRRIKNESCVHCGLCQKVCPTQAITIDRKTKYSYISNYDCVQCNKCNDSCKKDAIN